MTKPISAMWIAVVVLLGGRIAMAVLLVWPRSPWRAAFASKIEPKDPVLAIRTMERRFRASRPRPSRVVRLPLSRSNTQGRPLSWFLRLPIGRGRVARFVECQETIA